MSGLFATYYLIFTNEHALNVISVIDKKNISHTQYEHVGLCEK